MPIRAAVLDVDGTVATCPYDFDAMRAAVAEAAARWNVDSQCLGVRGVIEQIDRTAELLRDKGPAFREQAEKAVARIEVAFTERASLVPGAAEALADLRHSGVAVGLLTRNCRAASEIALRHLNDYDALLTRDDVPLAKPDPDHVLRTLAALDRSPNEAVMVGDHDYDMEAGRAADVRLCVGVRTGNRSDADLRSAGADDVLDSIADLPSWLRTKGELRG